MTMESLRFCNGRFVDLSFSGQKLNLRGTPYRSRRIGSVKTTVLAAAGTQVDSFVDGTITTVKSVGEVVKRGLDLIGQGTQVVKDTLPLVNEKIEEVTPVAKQVSKTASEATSTAVTAATPALKSAGQAAAEFLSGQGVDIEVVKTGTKTVAKTANDAINVATPAVKTSVNFLTTTEPLTLGYYALAAGVVYFFGPTFLSLALGNLRGYAGDISAASSLDSIQSDGNAVLIDIRMAMEKERTGVLDVPGNISGRVLELEFAFTENRKLRSQLRNPEDVESQITALQIAGLRRLTKSTTVFLLDRNGGSQSKLVAKRLKALGYGQCYVVSGGYAGWMQSKLQTKPSPQVFRAEVVAPTSVFTTALKGGTTQRTVQRGRRALPPPRK